MGRCVSYPLVNKFFPRESGETMFRWRRIRDFVSVVSKATATITSGPNLCDFVFTELGIEPIEPRALCKLGKCPTAAELHP